MKTSLLALLFGLAAVFGHAAPLRAETAPVPSPQIARALQIEEQFLTGLAALDAGQADQAIVIFQDILAQNPDLIRVRLELARAYFIAERWQRARSEFFAVLSADLPESVRQNVLRFIRAIDARRGFDWDLSIALARFGDTRAFRSDTLDLQFGDAVLPFTLARNSDTQLGLDIVGAAQLRRSLGEFGGAAVLGFGEAFVDLDAAEDRAFRDSRVGLRFGAQTAGANLTTSLALRADRRDLRDRHWENRFGIEAALERRSATGGSVFAGLTALAVDHRAMPDLDGASTTWQIGARQSLGGRAVLGLAAFGEHRRVDAGFEGYDTYGLRLFGRLNARYGLQIEPSLSWSRKAYLERNPVFTGNPDESRWYATLRVEKSDLFLAGAFSPFLSVDYEWVESGIEAFSFEDAGVQIGLNRQF
ncbi:MAG: tetratricopeptide repeat protein [Mangrovicoccus sp.]|nr:tetratricopeptide repeat protein [Mangrovicoccus sp.]